MASKSKDENVPEESGNSGDEPKVNDRRKVDPKTGEPRASKSAKENGRGAGASAPAEPATESGADSPTVELSEDDIALLAEAERDLVAEYRDRAARAEAELKNFRTRVERDRAANREAVIAEVIRTLIPAIDDLDRAEAHGDLVEGSPLAIVAQKLRAGFERYGLRVVGVKGEPFDPKLHEALVQLYSPDVTVNTVADVIEPGYALGERLIRAAKVAVSVPQP